MKILFWNVNGLRAVERKILFRPLLNATKPDIIGVQEIKAMPEQLSFFKVAYADYRCFWHSAKKPGYAGTGLMLHHAFLETLDEEPSVEVGIVGSSQFSDDLEGRVQCTTLKRNKQRIALLNIYFPNGGKSEQAWRDKLIFYDELLNYVNRLRDQGCIVIWGGDVNCAHQEIDLARPKENEGSIGFRPEERDWINRCVAAHWSDIFRQRYPKRIVYSWWHMVTRARTRNIGWRIDYAFIDQAYLAHIDAIDYLTEVQGSDHCPLLLSTSL